MDNIELNNSEANLKILQEKLVKIEERNDNRKRLESKRRKDRYELGSHAEQTDVFFKTLREQEKIIEIELQKANEAAEAGDNRSQLTIRLDNVFKIIDSLKRYLTESSMFLTAFDNEQAKKDFQTLQSKFATIRDRLLPKKKFGFNAKAVKVNEEANKAVEREVTTINRPVDCVEQSHCGFRDEHDRQDLVLQGEEVNGKDLSLLRLSRCRVLLLGSPGSVYISDLSDCIIVCGPTTRSVFVSQCNDNTFYFACQQARIHTTHNSQFYIHVTCTAIIEACDTVTFGPYLLSYGNLESDFERSKLNIVVNNWEKVEDFCHLSATTPSPNWSIIEEQDRKSLII